MDEFIKDLQKELDLRGYTFDNIDDIRLQDLVLLTAIQYNYENAPKVEDIKEFLR